MYFAKGVVKKHIFLKKLFFLNFLLNNDSLTTYFIGELSCCSKRLHDIIHILTVSVKNTIKME